MSKATRALSRWRDIKRELGKLNRDSEYMKINLEFGLPDSFLEDDCREMADSLETCESAVRDILREMKP